jgi:hypothetical protein
MASDNANKNDFGDLLSQVRVRSDLPTPTQYGALPRVESTAADDAGARGRHVHANAYSSHLMGERRMPWQPAPQCAPDFRFLTPASPPLPPPSPSLPPTPSAVPHRQAPAAPRGHHV